MDLKKLILGIDSGPSMAIRSEFNVKIERKVKDAVVQFDARVKGHFIPKGGKADFIAEEITVNGMESVNLRSFFPRELKDVQKYALSVEYPKALSRKLR